MKKTSLINLFIALLLISCNNYNKDVEYFETGEVRLEGLNYKKSKQGQWILRYKNGNVHGVGDYEKGELVGEWLFWNEEGLLIEKGTYLNSEKYGKWFKYENGVLKEELDFYKGEVHGFVKFFKETKGVERLEIMKFNMGINQGFKKVKTLNDSIYFSNEDYGDYLIHYNHFSEEFE